MWIVEVVVVLFMSVNHNLLAKQIAVVLAVKDIANAPRNMLVPVPIQKQVDFSWILEVSLKAWNKRDV
jgi:hypothetical protein